MRYLLPTLPAAAYLTLRNNGPQPEQLVRATSPACGTLMLHQSQDSGGMSMMTDVPSVTIPAGGSLTLAPGGYHLMCMQPRMQPGDKIHLTLTFQSGASVTTTLPVHGPNQAP